MSTEVAPAQIDSERVKELTERESEAARRGDAGVEAHVRARARGDAAAASRPRIRCASPWPIYLERGEGARVWDVDGRQLWDFHNGFGSMPQGHAHPAIVEAVEERVRAGHALRRSDRGRDRGRRGARAALRPAEVALQRTRAPRRRWTRSGSRAALNGRDTILKIFGSYHGHHDARDGRRRATSTTEIGDPDDIPSLPYGGGVPQAVADLTIAVPFNDADALERRIERLEQEGRKPACLIMEAAMMNIGVVMPEQGYLEAVRDITKRHDVVLIFDEVKTGLAIAAGGATERFGVKPDMVTLAKTLGGGLPSGAIGATDEVMAVVEGGTRLPGRHVQREPADDGRREAPACSRC